MPSSHVEVTLREADKFNLAFTIEEESPDSGTSALDLTGTTVTLYLKEVETGTLIVNGGAVTLVDAANGTCRYTLSTSETATVGIYVGYLRIVDLGSLTEEKRTADFTVVIGENYE